ncbi:dCTP pyrophosphatase 1 [Artemisia annua]|uniref:dCTP pyrophosphatase 1 n=1 Tax=Artemisia annua TaxID=35608 RepID=A0A2U1M3Z5_ARTAN|nr:dCTP pyrophosphatase 1 [Artemisia annua]
MSGVSEGEEVTLKLLMKKMEDFAKERDWEQYHSPRNLLLALNGQFSLFHFPDCPHASYQSSFPIPLSSLFCMPRTLALPPPPPLLAALP